MGAHMGKSTIQQQGRHERRDLSYNARPVDTYDETEYFRHNPGVEDLDETKKKDRADVIASFFARYGFDGKLNKFVDYISVFDTIISQADQWDYYSQQQGGDIYKWLQANNATRANG